MKGKPEQQDEFLRKLMKERGTDTPPHGLKERVMRQVEEESVFSRVPRSPVIGPRVWFGVVFGFVALIALLILTVPGGGGTSGGLPVLDRVYGFMADATGFMEGFFAGTAGVILAAAFLTIGVFLFLDQYLGQRTSRD